MRFLKDTHVKSMLIKIVSSLMIIFVLFVMMQWVELKEIYTAQRLQYQKIVGAIVELDPTLEQAVMEGLFSESKTHEQIGEEILAKYGYTEQVLMKDVLFESHFQKMISLGSVLFLSFCLIAFGFIVWSLSQWIQKLWVLDEVMVQMSEGNLTQIEELNTEGVLGRLYSDLNKLSRSLRIKIIKLDQDRHHLKSLVTDISHQLKTPLSSLQLYQSLLIEEELTEEERLEFLQTNQQSVHKLQQLIESLVQISRLEAGMMTLNPQKMDLKMTLLNAVQAMKSKASLKEIEVILTDFEVRPLYYDAKWTEEALINVLDNAIKYTPTHGRVEIWVNDSINFVQIHIKDNGIGIDVQEFNSIFKRFYRVKGSESLEGSGIGLYLTRKILEKQGGSIMVSSRRGEGSTFSLFLTKL